MTDADRTAVGGRRFALLAAACLALILLLPGCSLAPTAPTSYKIKASAQARLDASDKAGRTARENLFVAIAGDPAWVVDWYAAAPVRSFALGEVLFEVLLHLFPAEFPHLGLGHDWPHHTAAHGIPVRKLDIAIREEKS